MSLFIDSIIRQNLDNIELIICDDWSNSINVFNTINNIKKSLFDVMKITYVWQKDKYLRVWASRNNWVFVTNNKNIVFIDWDCILNNRFLERYKYYFSKCKWPTILSWERYYMENPNNTEENNFRKLLLNDKEKDFLWCWTCNLWIKSDLIIPFYDELFVWYWCEDIDLALVLKKMWYLINDIINPIYETTKSIKYNPFKLWDNNSLLLMLRNFIIILKKHPENHILRNFIFDILKKITISF